MAEPKVVRAGYRRIAEQLEQRIEEGFYPVGELLPSYDALAAEFAASKSVARDAVGILEGKGIVDVAAGIGTTVLRKPSDVPPAPDIPARLDEVAATVQRMSDQLNEQVTPDLADIREQLGVLQDQVMYLYNHLGVAHPQQQTDSAPRARGRRIRSA